MEKSKLEKVISSSELSDKNSTNASSKTQPNLDFSELINELTEINKEGDSFFKKSKFEEAKNKYLQGYNTLENETEKSLNLYSTNPQVNEILSLYKIFLTKIAECSYVLKNYEEAIAFDLKLLCLEAKNGQSIIRLFNCYSKIEKYQQAVYYGELYMELDEDIKEKYKNIEKEIDIEKEKLRKIQSSNKNRINIILFNIIIIIVIFSFSMLLYK